MNDTAVICEQPREVGQAREVFRLDTDMVAAQIPALRARMKDLVAAGAQQISMDLSTVRMVDSAGIGLLISAHNSLKKTGGSLELTHVPGEIHDLFRTMRMHQHFRISGAE